MNYVMAVIRNINTRVPEPDMDLIRRLLDFVNIESLKSAWEAERIIFRPPHPYTASESPPRGENLEVLNYSEFDLRSPDVQSEIARRLIEPIRQNRRIISRMLRDIANHNKAGIANLHETLREKLGMS